jgi:hypothetical protein
MKNRVLTTINLLLAIVLIHGISGINSSATAAQGQIRACAEKSTGDLRLASKCRSNEKRVSWNVRGPQGYPGENAYVNTKWVALSYIGNPGVAEPCGNAGDPTAYWTNLRVFNGWTVNADTVSNGWNWKGLTTCWISFKVIAD